MITLTKITEHVGGQSTQHWHLSGVQAGDLIFAMCSFYHGGNPYITLAGSCNPNNLIGESLLTTADGDVIGKVAEALANGECEITIGSDSESNLDAYSVVFRPSELTENVTAYIRTKVSEARAWTDPVSVLEGEYILCGQYASGATAVRTTPSAGDKSGTATVVVDQWELPEGSSGEGNSFFELLRVTGDGTFMYYGPNPTVMRITLQGDPMLVGGQLFRVGGEV